MTLGGVPFYLSLPDREQTLIGNIDRLFFERNGLLRNEFDELYQAIFSNAGKYLEVVTLLNGHKEGLTFAEISREIGIEGQRLTILLRNLERCDFIIAYSQFGNSQKGTLFRLVDFCTLFYYKFVLQNDTKDKDEKGAQIDLVIDRADHHITLCEMKFCTGRYRLTEDYATTLRDRMQLFADKTHTSKGLVNTFVSTFGLANSSGSSAIDNEITAEDLFL